MLSIGRALVGVYRHFATGKEASKLVETLMTGATVCALVAYRATVSRVSGRQCMFHPSCSDRALELVRAKGWSGSRVQILAQLDRCNGIYVMSFDGNNCTMETDDGAMFEEADIAPDLVRTYRQNHSRLIEALKSQHLLEN